MNQPDPRHAPTPEINQRLWQAWVHKNRELDKASAKNRLRFFQFVLLVAFVVAVSQQFIK